MRQSILVLGAALILTCGSFALAGLGESTSEKRGVKVAGLVVRWIRGDKAANYRRIEPMIREAAAKGAKIVVTTECFLDGYAIADRSIPLEKYRALGEPIPDGVYFRKLAALAAELKIYLVAGMTEADGDARYNTVVIIGPDGKLIGKYRKQRLGHELGRNTPGAKSPVFQTPFGRIGVMICADRRDPKLVQRLCQNGADFLLCPSGGMFGPKTNDPILQTRSRENRAHIVFVHPVEFLVTGPSGKIHQRELNGKNLLIPRVKIDSDEDNKRICYVDLPVGDRPKPEIIYRENVVYGQVHGAGLLADIAYPKSKKPLPAVISVHGGRWRGGHRRDGSTTKVNQWAGFGFFAMSIDYRLVGCTPAPACYQDMQCAIRYMHAHADKYNIDKNRIFLIGQSAGGHMVSLAATMGDGPFPRTGGWEKASNDFRAAISVAANYELNTLSWGKIWTPKGADPIKARRLASPVNHVSKKTKPLLILHSDNDRSVPIQNALLMVDALRKAKAEYRFHRYPKMGHMGINDEVIERSLEFIATQSVEK